MARPAGGPDPAPSTRATWVAVEDRARLAGLLADAAAGAPIFILPPGLSADGKKVLVQIGD